tara:strand:+ start:141 stop:3491 length:3351 start_codon:yes stop_codon:yes gene_type:complete
MKKAVFISCMLSINAFAQNTSLQLLENTSRSSQFIFQTGALEFKTSEFQNDYFTLLEMEGMTKSYDIGNPDLPVFTKLIEVPAEGDISIDIFQKNFIEIDLAQVGFPYQVFPSQPSRSKKHLAAEIRLIFNNQTYSVDEFYSQDLISVERIGVMRGKSIARLQIAPLSYNPLTNSILEVEYIQFNLAFENSIQPVKSVYQSPSFETHFSKLANQSYSKSNFSNAPIQMILLADPMFEDALQDFIQWKTRKGIQVIEVYKGQDGVGNTAESMKAYVQSIYENATDDTGAPTYLLIVGDHEQMPSFDEGQHVSDMYYCEFDGDGDYLPEMFYGRFSANSVSELLPQIEKTLQYEQYTMSDPTYLDEMLMVAGVDSYFASTHGNGQINYGTDYYFNSAHDLTTHTFLYPESDTQAAEQAIVDHISEGVGFANYTAHCGPAGWSDPSFEVYDVISLQNEDQYGLFIGNCCQSNTFDGTTCLGEALLRAEKKGAVGYIGATNNTLWDEDFYWGVGNGPISANPTYNESSAAVYDCTFHENEEVEEIWTITQGQMLQAGNWAVSESNADDKYYWEIYMLMGDPTVLTYYGRPSILEVVHSDVLPLGASSLNISTEQYTYVAINQSGVLLDASYSDVSGDVTLSFDPLNNIDPIEIVASKQNKQIYISEVNVIASDAPFIVYSGLSINDGDSGNGLAESGESFNVDVNLHNYGVEPSSSLQFTVNTSNSDVVISSNPISIEDMPGEGDTTIIDAFSIELQGMFQDQDPVSLIFTVSDAEGNEWITYGSFLVNAPFLDVSSHSLNDSDENGFLDFGESAELYLYLNNTGHANSSGGIASISSDFSYLEILDNEVSFDAFAQGQQSILSFPIMLSDDAPPGQSYSINIDIINEEGYSDAYSVTFETSNCPLAAMEVELNLATDWFADEILWQLSNTQGEVIGFADFNSLESQTTYQDLFCIIPNSYLTFTIEDNYGDGLNSEGYTITVCGQTIASGSDYGNGESISFIAGCDQSLMLGCTNIEAANYNEAAIVEDGSCESGIGFTELENKLIIFPNPAKNILFVRSEGLLIESLYVMDLSGKKLISFFPIDGLQEINLMGLDVGSYLIIVQTLDGLSIRKSLIIH